MKIDESWYVKPKKKYFPSSEKAGGIVVRKEKLSFLVALVGDRRYSEFSLPKGGIETGETPLFAAKREIEEELGLNRLKLLRKVYILERFSFRKNSWNRYHYFLFTTLQEEGKQKLTPDEKYYYLKWSNIDKLPAFFWPEQRKLVEECRGLIYELLK